MLDLEFVMKKLVLLIMIMCFALHGKATNYADYVNPLIGTQSTYEFSSGNTYPAIARPWGMNFWTPQTGKMGDGWQYMYTATKIRGFKQTHQPSPWINDYGQFSIMPVVGEPVFQQLIIRIDGLNLIHEIFPFRTWAYKTHFSFQHIP